MYNYLIRRCGVLMLMMFAAACAPGQVAPRVQEERGYVSCAFGVDWRTVTAEEAAAINDVGTQTQGDITSLHYAARYSEYPEVIEVLLAAGADIGARGGLLSNTPLHYAARDNIHPAVIEALVAAGADMEARNRIMGVAPLHFAVWNNKNPAVAEALLAAGADAKAQDNAGKTPFYYAELNKNIKGTGVYRKLKELQ